MSHLCSWSAFAQWPGCSLSCRTRTICAPECIVTSDLTLVRFALAWVRFADLALVLFADLALVRLVCFITRPSPEITHPASTISHALRRVDDGPRDSPPGSGASFHAEWGRFG